MSALSIVALLVGLAVGAAALVWARRAVARSEATSREHACRAQAAAAQQELLQTLLDASPLAIVLCADSGRIVFENEAARQMFFEGASCTGHNFLRLIASGPEPFRAALLGASDELVSLEVDGGRESYHFARRTLSYLGEPHTLLIVRSMTQEVARRDLALLRAVVRLISHEVNNSLAPISSLVHSARLVLGSGERLERLERVFDTVQERAAHLSSFIAEYAHLSRLPKPAPRLLAWEAILAPLMPLFPEATLQADAGARGFVDPTQLEQALINLLRNAMEAGGPREAVRLEVSALPGDAAELCVLDRGAGFSSEALESALLPFYTTKPGGSGVGLALVREIVHAHRGRLSLAAREGGGAAVRVWLPGPERAQEPVPSAHLTLTRG